MPVQTQHGAVGVEEETFGELLRRLREHVHLKQPEFADRIGISVKTVQNIENEGGRPKMIDEFDVVRRMADVLAVPVSILSSKLGWMPAEEFQSPPWELAIWNDSRFSEEDKQMLIRSGRNALNANRTS